MQRYTPKAQIHLTREWWRAPDCNLGYRAGVDVPYPVCPFALLYKHISEAMLLQALQEAGTVNALYQCVELGGSYCDQYELPLGGHSETDATSELLA